MGLNKENSVTVQVKDKENSRGLTVYGTDLQSAYNHIVTLFSALEEVEESVTLTFCKKR